MIHEKENQLFEQWKVYCLNRAKGDNDLGQYRAENFVSDGVFDEAVYAASPVKILYVLKEAHGNESFDLRDAVGDGKRPETWSNIARWTYLIHAAAEFGVKNVKWSDIVVDKDFRRTQLKTIAVMNLKKIAGAASTKMNVLNKFLCDMGNEYAQFFVRQFQLYKPDLVICCGSGVAAEFSKLMRHAEAEWQSTAQDVWYYPLPLSEEVPVVDWHHPQSRIRSSMMAFHLLNNMPVLIPRKVSY